MTPQRRQPVECRSPVLKKQTVSRTKREERRRITDGVQRRTFRLGRTRETSVCSIQKKCHLPRRSAKQQRNVLLSKNVRACTSAQPWYFPPRCSRARLRRQKSLTYNSLVTLHWRRFTLFNMLRLLSSSTGFFFFTSTKTLRSVKAALSRPLLFWMPNVSSFPQTHLFPPNWHEAATSSCQSNKLMLSGIDCVLFATDGPKLQHAHWENKSNKTVFLNPSNHQHGLPLNTSTSFF